MAYRDAEVRARYVCIVCFETASTIAGFCPRCAGAPLQSLDDPQVVIDLRRRAGARLDRQRRIESGIIGGTATVVAIGLFATLLVTGVYDLSTKHQVSGRGGAGVGEFWPLVIAWAFLLVLGFALYPRVFKNSASASKFDAESADVPALVAFLGLEVT